MRYDAARHIADIFFIMHFKWQLAKASESMRCVAMHCGAVRKELSVQRIKTRLPHRIQTRSPRFRCSWMTETVLVNCFSQFNCQIWIIMVCSSFNFEKLINLVQKYQFLYDKSHKYCCNNIIKENAWTEICNSLGNTTGNYITLYDLHFT